MLQFLVNKTFSKKWATMIELMAMLAIVGLWVWSMFAVITSGIYFSKDTEDTIKAINLAREWIEWVTNIRNTNWLRFSSDRQNCWKSRWYDALCIWNSVVWDKIWSGSYTLYTVSGLWQLSGSTIIDPISSWGTYSTAYATIQDNLWFYNQTGSVLLPCTSTLQKSCKTIFTREIVISEPAIVNPNILYVKSVVYWNTKQQHKVELETTLTNWKAKF